MAMDPQSLSLAPHAHEVTGAKIKANAEAPNCDLLGFSTSFDLVDRKPFRQCRI
ncbi:hypothetical protein CCACVL1_12537 [Corchorus capsularis]|uniref:Uncharacterized protein n=1 Tax=Corchorus capsularis TaxID=210143 RepID=A0A1R3IFF4_COCAP|nr:hypothetical protein CCACVL1_12537 [Corchorus capsularis]